MTTLALALEEGYGQVMDGKASLECRMHSRLQMYIRNEMHLTRADVCEEMGAAPGFLGNVWVFLRSGT